MWVIQLFKMSRHGSDAVSSPQAEPAPRDRYNLELVVPRHIFHSTFMSDRAVGGTLRYRSIRLFGFLLERRGEPGEKSIDKVKQSHVPLQRY